MLFKLKMHLLLSNVLEDFSDDHLKLVDSHQICITLGFLMATTSTLFRNDYSHSWLAASLRSATTRFMCDQCTSFTC